MNQTVNLRVKDIKKLAKQMYAGRFMQCLAVVFCCQIVALAPEYICYLFVDNTLVNEIATLVSALLRIVLTLASYGYCLKISRGENPGLDDIVDTFNLTGSAIILEIISYVGIALRYILLIVPGIIYSLKIGFAKYILTDNPTMAPRMVLNQSKKLLSSNLNKYLKLQLSYIWIYVLCILPKSIYSSLCGPDMSLYSIDPTTMSVERMQAMLTEAMNVYADFVNSPIMIALSLLTTVCITYVILCNGCFYDLCAGNIVVEEHDDATDIEY